MANRAAEIAVVGSPQLVRLVDSVQWMALSGQFRGVDPRRDHRLQERIEVSQLDAQFSPWLAGQAIRREMAAVDQLAQCVDRETAVYRAVLQGVVLARHC